MNNGYFKTGDPCADKIGVYSIPPEWWSRVYEYPWALTFAGKNMTVADMGCGWQQRPFKDALAGICKKVYAVDQHWEVETLEPHPNMEFIVADFTRTIKDIPDVSLDRVFCLSVLEELDTTGMYDALFEFAWLLRRGGMCIITADVVYDPDKPTPYCGGINPQTLVAAMKEAGLIVSGVDYDKAGAMYSEQFNLCVFHCIGVKP